MSAIPLAGSGRSKSFYSLLFMAKMAKAGNYSTLKATFKRFVFSYSYKGFPYLCYFVSFIPYFCFLYIINDGI